MPAPRKPACTGAAPQGWQAAFLVSLRQNSNVSAAARAAGTCRSRCYEARQRDRSFAASIQQQLSQIEQALGPQGAKRPRRREWRDRRPQGPRAPRWPRGHVGPQGARGPRRAGDATGPAGPASSNAAIPTDGISVETKIFSLFESPWGRHYANNFTFRPVGGCQNLSERSHTVIFDRQMQPRIGIRIDYGEWRCIHVSDHGIQNTGGFFGTFVGIT